jgi:hypothetical protein
MIIIILLLPLGHISFTYRIKGAGGQQARPNPKKPKAQKNDAAQQEACWPRLDQVMSRSRLPGTIKHTEGGRQDHPRDHKLDDDDKIFL